MMINFYEYQKIGSTILQQHALQPVSDLSYWTSESIRNVFAAKLPLYFSKQMNLCTWKTLLDQQKSKYTAITFSVNLYNFHDGRTNVL